MILVVTVTYAPACSIVFAFALAQIYFSLKIQEKPSETFLFSYCTAIVCIVFILTSQFCRVYAETTLQSTSYDYQHSLQLSGPSGVDAHGFAPAELSAVGPQLEGVAAESVENPSLVSQSDNDVIESDELPVLVHQSQDSGVEAIEMSDLSPQLDENGFASVDLSDPGFILM